MKIHSLLVYMTIDLDYWNNSDIKAAHSIIKRVLGMHLPMKIYSDHKQIVKDIPIFCEHILNVDQHDDIFTTKNLTGKFKTLGNDNWVNFVKQRKTGIYEWRHPSQFAHYCDVIDQLDNDKAWEKRDTGWKSMVARAGLNSLPWTRVYALSFVISEDFTNMNVLFDLLPLLNHPRIPPANKNTEKLIKSYCRKPKREEMCPTPILLKFPTTR